MRPRTTLIIIAGLALLAGIVFLFDEVRPERYALMPGAVTGSRAEGITATFTLVQERLIDPGEQGQQPVAFPRGAIETNREGGACLVLSADDLGWAEPGRANCVDDQGCVFPQASFGYCAPAGKRCWVKPNPKEFADQMCRKSRLEKFKLEPGVVNRGPKDGTLPLTGLTLPADRTVRARLITCLEKPAGTKETGCPARGKEMVERWGPEIPL